MDYKFSVELTDEEWALVTHALRTAPEWKLHELADSNKVSETIIQTRQKYFKEIRNIATAPPKNN